MNRSSLARALAQKTSLSVRQAENLIIALGAIITKALERNEKVIYSNFGSFYTIEYPSKTLTHPKSGQKMVILPVKVAKFMPSDWLKKYVNDGIDMNRLEKLQKELNINSEYAEEIPISVSHKAAPADTKIEEEIKVDEAEKAPEEVKIQVDEPEQKSEAKPQPAKAPVSILGQAHEEDDIEAYHRHKQELQSTTNFYEEILSDGSHEFSTTKGSIKIPRKAKPEEPAADKAETPDSKEDQENKVVADEADNEESLSPLESLRRKLGIGRKKDSAAVSQSADTAPEELSTPTAPEAPEIPLEAAPEATMPAANLTGNGIFDKNLAKTPKGMEPANQSENKIEQIKNRLKPEVEQPSMLEDSLPTSPAPVEDVTPVFSGIEGSLNFDKAKIEYKDLSKAIVSKDLLSKIPERIARSYKAVAFEQNDDVISVAMVDPEDVESREMLKHLLDKKVKIFLATESDISSVLNQYQGLETEVSSAIASAKAEEEEEEKENKGKGANVVDTANDDAPAAKIVSSLLKRAIRDKASDIHIEPTEKEVEVRFRVDGILRKKVSLPKDIQAAVISRIKILSNLKIDEQRVPQDGRFNIHIDNRRVDFRISSMPVAFGEKIVMRILDKESGILTIEELGIRGSGLKVLDGNLNKSHGMVLVTGPTGSGKSTTLYAMIQKVFNEGVNIITLEDPIEYQMKGINQSQVNSDIGYTFAAGLRSILRQDPDIIMLGEIRDRETAEMAVHAALTGHVVLSTLHTNDAAGAAPRMIDMGVEPFLLTSSINVVVGQRLVRKLCQECKEEVKLSDEEIEQIKKEISQMPSQEQNETAKREMKFYKNKGCKSCANSGYKGRIGIYEVLEVTPEMQQLILKRVSSEELNKLAVSQGMVTMIQDGILKALDGITSMEEVWRATKN